MISKSFAAAALSFFILQACSSNPVSVDLRTPAGTGDIDSSTKTESFESYKLPITREGKKTTRVAYNFWSGEYPSPVVDINSDKPGTTTIKAYTELRDPKSTNRVNCTVKNGIYHPWSDKDPSSLTYYSLSSREEYTAIVDTTIGKLKVPKGSVISNVVYYAENYCGAILRNKKTARPISESCDVFRDTKTFERISASEGEFSEQWLYFICAEKKADGSALKVFVRDEDLIKQPGIQTGCPSEYGKVQGAKACAN